MIHYSCDRCKRVIDNDQEIRYSVRIEIQATMDPVAGESNDDDRDHLVELQSILGQMDDSECAEISENAYQRRRYDLCSDCHRKFLKNPLAIDPVAKLEFSDN